ncbi:MAG: hypothetical protein IRZ03_18540 [Acidobacterium ailaaui]|nr:hypothetical protein [Pseudacidobacterium ailaaui]
MRMDLYLGIVRERVLHNIAFITVFAAKDKEAATEELKKKFLESVKPEERETVLSLVQLVIYNISESMKEDFEIKVKAKRKG